MNILKRLCELWRDKKLAQQCGLKVEEICSHEADMQLEAFKTLLVRDRQMLGDNFKCIKCGEFYK